jgi:Lon protease-like protein
MRGELLPLFPLQTVLLPRAPLPLHIFEERYREMMAEVLARNAEFGVVLGRGDGIVNIGCTARVERVLRRHEDGRLDVLCVGVRRFRLLEVDQSRSYARGRVEPIEDDDPSPARQERAQAALAAWLRYAQATGEETAEVDADDPELSFLLAASSPDLEFRQVLLGMRSEARRIDWVIAHFDERLEQWKRQEAMRRTAGTNGHGKHWKG